MKKFTLFLSLLFVGFQAFAGEFDHEKTLELYNLARKEQETTDEKQNQAFEKKLLQEADELLAQGANPNYPISPIDSTIFCALENGHTGLVEKLIKHGASLPEAIHLPFFKEKGFNASCITDLYSLGKKENLRSCRRTWNALHLAAFLGHEELVK